MAIDLDANRIRIGREREAMRRQTGSHSAVAEKPDATAMGAESAEYIAPTIDPQWIDAWKMFVDEEGEYGVPVRLPRGQWAVGGPNALENQRRPDGGFWFTQIEPKRKAAVAKHECFVGNCTRKTSTIVKLITHVEAYHHEEAKAYSEILKQMRLHAAQDDPRLQRLLASMDGEQPVEQIATAGGMSCDECEATSPEGHASAEAWLRGHKLGAHKEA